jgi:trimethylamine monooxygenase
MKVSNRHYNEPSVPQIDGLHLYKKRVMHSHDYRDAKDYAQQNVLVVGGSFSALDITMQLARHAKKVK